MKRRMFLMASSGLLISRMAVSADITTTVLACEAENGIEEPEPYLHLGLSEAKELERGLPYPDSFLRGLPVYATASVEALNYLSQVELGFVRVGFRELTPEMAQAISQWQTRIDDVRGISFRSLKHLTPEAAKALNPQRIGYVDLACLKSLPVQTAIKTNRALLPYALGFKP